MSTHTIYPHMGIDARPTRGKRLVRILCWLLAIAVVLAMLACVIGLIAHLATVEAQMDNVFMQGMKAGHGLCLRGV